MRIALITLALTSAMLCHAADITFTLGNAAGDIRPLTGLNIGPLRSGSTANADLTTFYRQLEVPLVRNHDFYGPLDMSVMYPDRSKDPALASSYNFAAAAGSDTRSSDTLYGGIVNGGFEPYFRLGDSYNNVKPPTDAERPNWIKAAIEVLRHYREGKNSGFNNSFRYVEIWNEPDNTQFWPAPFTQDQYLKLYEETSKALRTAFPSLKIGGPGFTPGGCLSPTGQAWVKAFLDDVKSKGSPLDFLSWHLYTPSPDDVTTCAKFYRQELDSRGFTAVESHITEYNTPNSTTNPTLAAEYRYKAKGAAIMTGAWMNMQKQGIKQAMFYRGTDPDINAPTFYGMFYADGRPKKIGWAAYLWRDIGRYSRWVDTVGLSTDIYTLAADNGNGGRALLLANIGDSPRIWNVAFADGKTIADYRINLQSVSDAADGIVFTAPSGDITLPAKSVQLAFFTPKNQVFSATVASVLAGSVLTLTGKININAADVGQVGNIWVAGTYAGKVYYYDGKSWALWTSGDLPPFFSGTLPSTFSPSLFQQTNIAGLTGVNIYIGYGLNLTDMVNRKLYSLVYQF